jgi:hypothetical protein
LFGTGLSLRKIYTNCPAGDQTVKPAPAPVTALCASSHYSSPQTARRCGRDRPALSRTGKAAADGEDACGSGDWLFKQPERNVAHVSAGADHRDSAVIGLALQMVDVVFAREFAFDISPRKASRKPGCPWASTIPSMTVLPVRSTHVVSVDRDLASASNLSEAAVLDDESGIFNPRAAITGR